VSRIFPKKWLGQHFLTNPNIALSMSSLVRTPGAVVLEVGAGTGNLTTKLLLNENISRVIAIDIDKDSIEYASNQFRDHINRGKLELLEIDGLQLKIQDLADRYGQKITIISNLPYHIGASMVMNWINELDSIEQIVVMLQEEVVDRFIASPGSKKYGRISILIQIMCHVEKIMRIKPENFYPIPLVNSAIIEILPKASRISIESYGVIDALCEIGFLHRRKTLLNCLKACVEISTNDIDAIFPSILDRNIRIEALDISKIFQIAHVLHDILMKYILDKGKRCE